MSVAAFKLADDKGRCRSMLKISKVDDRKATCWAWRDDLLLLGRVGISDHGRMKNARRCRRRAIVYQYHRTHVKPRAHLAALCQHQMPYADIMLLLHSLNARVHCAHLLHRV